MKHLLVQVYSPTNAEGRGDNNSVVVLLVSYSNFSVGSVDCSYMW